MKLNSTYKKVLLSALTLSVFFIAFDGVAQIGPPPEDPPCGFPFDPCVPIDGGAGLLLAIGAIYGGKKVLQQRKKAD